MKQHEKYPSVGDIVHLRNDFNDCYERIITAVLESNNPTSVISVVSSSGAYAKAHVPCDPCDPLDEDPIYLDAWHWPGTLPQCTRLGRNKL